MSKTKKIKTLHVSSSLGGGIVTIIESLLKKFNNDFFSSEYILFEKQNDVKKILTIVNTFFKFRKSYLYEIEKTDIVHFHGAWRLHILLLSLYRPKQPTIVSLHGALDSTSLKKSKFKKFLVKKLYMEKALKSSTCIHALTQKEAKDIRSYGIRNVPIEIIPNGIDMHENLKIDTQFKKELLTISKGRRIILSLSRLHSAKGIDMLIEAFGKLNKKNDENVLFIVGEGDEIFKNKLTKLIELYGLKECVFLLGEMFGVEKNTVYDVADVFVLPSLNEGFGLTVLEALRQNTPVIATNVTPFKELEEVHCGWYIDPMVSSLYDALEDTASMTRDELKAMGKNGYVWVKKNYSLERINKRYEMLYLHLVDKSSTYMCDRE